MEPFPKQRSGLFRPKVPQRVPKQIPDAAFNELFARLGSHRDRALVAFWVSAGARASELLSVTGSGADPGQQLITVIRKGSRAMQQIPASPDAFVWLRLYQQEVNGLVPARPDDPLWWTLRRPFRPLTYDTARKMFDRANDAADTEWTLHSLRHTAAYAAITALADGGLPCSGRERRILLLSAGLAGGTPVSLRDTVTGLDDDNAARLITAIRHSSGKRP